MIVAVLSSTLTLILPLSAPPPPLQYTLYPDTVAGGVQETLIVVKLTSTALISAGESAAVGEKEHFYSMYSYIHLHTNICFVLSKCEIISYRLLLGCWYLVKVF